MISLFFFFFSQTFFFFRNSLDAGSTQIKVLIKDGGMKHIQIIDNGHGIRVNLNENVEKLRNDEKILCFK